MEYPKNGPIRHESRSRGVDTAWGEASGGVRMGEYVDRIAKELHDRVEHQRVLLRKALCEGGAGKEEIRYCPLVDCARIERLRSAVRETVGVLEETRSAFKSKRLEVMRRKLIEILSES